MAGPSHSPHPNRTSPLPLIGLPQSEAVAQLGRTQVAFQLDPQVVDQSFYERSPEWIRVGRLWVNGGKCEPGAVVIILDGEPDTTNTFKLTLEIRVGEGVPVRNAPVYSLEDLEVKAIEVTTGHSHIVEGGHVGRTQLVFKGLRLTSGYTFTFHDGGRIVTDRDHSPALSLKAAALPTLVSS